MVYDDPMRVETGTPRLLGSALHSPRPSSGGRHFPVPILRATSALDLNKYTYEPLQDNVAIVLDAALVRWPFVRTLLLGWRVDMHWLLIVFVALCLSVLWCAVPYSGFGMATRFLTTVAWTHALRTVAFVITVLPNPRRNCYVRSFALPPEGASLLHAGMRACRCSARQLWRGLHSVESYCPVPIIHPT